MIKLIEIEVYNYCNRRCSFCPNSKVSSRQNKQEVKRLDFNSFSKFIDQLKQIDYSETISFSRYNEPLAFLDETSKYVSYVRDNLKCKIVSNTNGDYLNRDSIELFDELTIMDYANKGQQWWKNKLESMEAELDVNSSNDEFLFFRTKKNKDALVFLNFKSNATIEDRGGIIKTNFIKFKNGGKSRERPCYEPQKFLGIDYNGSVMVCCNMNSDFHEDYSIGNINYNTLDEIVNSSKRKNIIEIMSSDNHNKYLEPCKNCQKDPGRYTRENPGIFYNGERK